MVEKYSNGREVIRVGGRFAKQPGLMDAIRAPTRMPKADVTYTLSVHDLLGAFSMAGFYDVAPESDKGEIVRCPYCGNRAYEEDVERPADICHHEAVTPSDATDKAAK